MTRIAGGTSTTRTFASSWALAAACVTVMATSCAKQYVRVEVSALDVRGLTSPAEVSPTESYRKKLDELRTFAIRLPEVCVTEGAGIATGRAAASDTIMVTTCAVWLGELERSLVGAGYRVISWDSVHRMAMSMNLSTYEAARRQGVDALIMVNSLEANPIKAGSLAEQQLTYYRSNPDGDAHGVVELPTRARTAIRDMVARRFILNDAQGNNAVSATLDATVISVSDNEAIWFYRNTLAEPLSAVMEMVFLFRGNDRFYRAVRPLSVADTEDGHDEIYAPWHERIQSSEGMQTDPYREFTHRLTRSISQDFVQRFRSGLN